MRCSITLGDVVSRGFDYEVLYYTWADRWQGPLNLGGFSEDAPAITSWGPNRLDVLIKGGDGVLQHRFWNGSRWSDWEFVVNPLYSGPAAVSWGPDRIDVFGMGAEGQLLHIWFSN
jgi:hypothetical protein